MFFTHQPLVSHFLMGCGIDHTRRLRPFRGSGSLNRWLGLVSPSLWPSSSSNSHQGLELRICQQRVSWSAVGLLASFLLSQVPPWLPSSSALMSLKNNSTSASYLWTRPSACPTPPRADAANSSTNSSPSPPTRPTSSSSSKAPAASNFLPRSLSTRSPLPRPSSSPERARYFAKASGQLAKTDRH